MPTIGGNYCSVGELPAEGAAMEPAWSRFLSPVLRLRNIMTPGPADQKESPEFFTSREPYPRLSERPDVLVYQTEPLAEPVEVTGRAVVNLWISSSAPDTDFTAKLVDVYPPNEDYPDGYDMLINDSIIRCRYREGFDREVFLTPGEIVPVSILLPPTSNVFAVGHRIRIDVSSSNFPRLERNPNTGEPIGRHTHEVVRRPGRLRRRGAPVARRPAGHSWPVSALEFVAVPGGPFAMGVDPAQMYPPDEDETPRRTVRVEGFRIARLPVTGDDGVPVTYVSRDEAEAFCAANGVRLPTEVEWEAAARGGDDRLWPWGDEPPDTTRATFGRGIGGPSRAGLHPAGAAPCGALDLAGNVYEWTADGAVRGGSYLSGADELRCSARLPVHPAARDTYIGFRVVAVEPRRSFDWVDVPAGDYVIGRDADESRQRVVEVDGVRARANTRHERAVRALRRRVGRCRPSALARPLRPPGHVRRLGRGVRVLRLGRRASADRGRMGEGRAWHGRAHVPLGRRGGRGPRRGRARAEARLHLAGRLPPRRRQPVRSAGHGRKRLGMDVDGVPAG